MEHYDVIVIGGGGGTLAHRLAPSGKRILLLERGDFQPQVHYFVGGATKLYGAALYRLRAEDFGELQHHDGLSPAWPLGYDDIEPYYTQAEQLYQVRGARGEDPTEPPASAPYRSPP